MNIQQGASRALKNIAKRVARRMGYTIAPVTQPDPAFAGLDDRFLDVLNGMENIGAFEIKQYTTYAAVEYALDAGLDGDFIECGVYQGRQVLMMAQTLVSRGVTDREIYLYDTFSGQIKPTPADYKDKDNPEASYKANLARWEKGQITGASKAWKVATVDEVRANVFRSGYPEGRFHFVEGDVLKTLPNDNHARIAVLRLDTDWYESTRHELECLYDRVVVGGVLIVDDYGRWRGCRKAVDEFFARLGPRAPMLVRTGPSERLCIKTVA